MSRSLKVETKTRGAPALRKPGRQSPRTLLARPCAKNWAFDLSTGYTTASGQVGKSSCSAIAYTASRSQVSYSVRSERPSNALESKIGGEFTVCSNSDPANV